MLTIIFQLILFLPFNDLQLPKPLAPVRTKVVILNRACGKVYSLQFNVIPFFSDLRQISGFLQVLWFLSPI
jgi:hypothetical protein